MEKRGIISILRNPYNIPRNKCRQAQLEAADILESNEKELEELRQQVCDECSPDDYGWKYNRVDGKHPCTCITESGAFQDLEKKLELARKLLEDSRSIYKEDCVFDINWNDRKEKLLNQKDNL